SCSWDTTKTPDGQHTLAAKVSDAAGNTTTKTITVTVANAPVNAAPTVTLKTSADGTTFVRWITLTATATDDKAVSKVEFYVAGKLVFTDTASPYSVYWDSRNQIGSGSHTATAKAYDAQGLTATASVQVRKK
ncbi:MAG: Ig-like domain-containing protein, partial [Solirubrobacterales bacterium]|nr:Ig-like domain-containing protein [Solirubrobacterales bacterium]